MRLDVQSSPGIPHSSYLKSSCLTWHIIYNLGKPTTAGSSSSPNKLCEGKTVTNIYSLTVLGVIHSFKGRAAVSRAPWATREPHTSLRFLSFMQIPVDLSLLSFIFHKGFSRMPEGCGLVSSCLSKCSLKGLSFSKEFF